MTDKKPMGHGVSADLVEPDWPMLTLAEVERVLSLYPQAAGAREIVSYSPRPFSAASVVATAFGNVFVKRHHGSVRDVAGLLEEHRFMEHLRRQGAPVPNVLRGKDGSSVVGLDQWTYEVHAIAEGVDLYRDAMSWTPFLSVPHARSAGNALASLHVAAQGYDAPRRKRQPLVSSFTIFAAADPWIELTRYVERRPALAEYLSHRNWHNEVASLLMPFYEVLRPHLGELTPLWTHNDWHASNLLWSESGEDAKVASVIDFGLADRTCAIYDMATAIERNAVEWLKLPEPSSQIVRFDQVGALLDGYASRLPISARQYLALSAILPLVHAEFALAEIEYFAGITRSDSNARIAYESFLLGHAAWFNSEEGRHLLGYLSHRHSGD